MDLWTIDKISDLLEQNGIAREREADNLAVWIWEEIFGKDKNDSSDIDSHQLNGILERLKTGEPIQYIAGHAWFWGLKFNVSPAVLTGQRSPLQYSGLHLKHQLKPLLPYHSSKTLE